MEDLTNNTNLTQTILDTINQLFNQLFSSIDNSIYSTLDNLVFINPQILQDSLFEKLFGTSASNGLLLIANSLLISFTLFYCFKLLYSNFTGISVEQPYQFIFKLLLVGIIMNSSYFICERMVYLNSLISSSICELGTLIFQKTISFSSLIQNLDSIISIDGSSLNVFSFDGLLKSFISISLFNLLFSYSLRYIMIKVFILLTPFSFLTLINSSTSWFFKMWFRTVFSLLIMQSFISIILLITFSFSFQFSDTFSKLMCIGSIYALIRANSYIQQLIGGISTDVSNHSNLTKLFLSR